MSALKTRIARLGRQAPNLTPVTGGQVYGAVQTPGNLVTIEPGIGAGIGPLSALVTSDGAAVPATGPGRWDQLIAAGRT